MLFGRHRRQQSHEHHDGNNGSYRYRVDSRDELVSRYETYSAGKRRVSAEASERQRLAAVLEEMSGEGWRLVGVAGADFVFRRRS